MQDLLANPAVQAAVMPFAVAMVLAWFLYRPALLGLAVPAAVLTACALAIGLSLEPLTATRKLVLIAVAGSAPVVWIARRRQVDWRTGVVLATLAAAAALWVLWRVLAQKEGGQALVPGAAAALFTAAMVEATRRFARSPVDSAAAALSLGLGAGALALLGASALLAQLGIAIAASAGALLLVQSIRGRAEAPAWSLSLVAGVAAALLAEVSIFTGSLPWFAAVPLLAVPWAATWFAGNERRPVWLAAGLAGACALIPVLAALALAWAAATAAS